MTKLVATTLLCIIGLQVVGQISIQAFGSYSMPSVAWLNDDRQTIAIAGTDPFILEDKDIFTTFSEPSFGLGFGTNYLLDHFSVGIEISYVEYAPATELLRLVMFRIGPTIDYYFLDQGKVRPFIGIETGLRQAKAFFNGEVFSRGQISDTHIGIGLRAGTSFEIDENWLISIRASYVYLNLPYFDLSLGISRNLVNN